MPKIPNGADQKRETDLNVFLAKGPGIKRDSVMQPNSSVSNFRYTKNSVAYASGVSGIAGGGIISPLSQSGAQDTQETKGDKAGITPSDAYSNNLRLPLGGIGSYPSSSHADLGSNGLTPYGSNLNTN